MFASLCYYTALISILMLTQAAMGRSGCAIDTSEDAGPSGRHLNFDNDQPNLAGICWGYGLGCDREWNDRISGFNVQEGYWTLCEHERFGGRCIGPYGPGSEIANLDGLSFNDTISSLKCVSAATPSRAPAPATGSVPSFQAPSVSASCICDNKNGTYTAHFYTVVGSIEIGQATRFFSQSCDRPAACQNQVDNTWTVITGNMIMIPETIDTNTGTIYKMGVTGR